MMKIFETKVIKKEIESYEVKTKATPIVDIRVNGASIDPGITYVENNAILLFKDPLQEGDLLQIEFDLRNEKIMERGRKVFTKSRYGKGAIYQLYSDEVKFKFNTKYLLHLEYEECFDSEFSSKYDPFYTTIKQIRTDTGGLLENVSDSAIATVIFDNSVLANDKLGEDFEFEDDKVPLYVKNFVRYKTDIDLCYAIYLSKTGKLGSFKKKLGDLDVSNEIKLPDLEKMLSRFKDLLKPNEEQLEGDNDNTSFAFIKAKKITYPVSKRGVF